MHRSSQVALNVPKYLGAVSRMSHPPAILLHEHRDRASSRRARICAPSCRQPRGSGLFHRRKENRCVILVYPQVILLQLSLGYLFCAEIMPPRHDLKLMLVNTLRKVHKPLVQADRTFSHAALGPRGQLHRAHHTRSELPHPVPK